MMRKPHNPQFKTKIVLAILSGEKELNAAYTENNLNPNMVRKWKQEFLENAHNIFDTRTQNKENTRKEQELKKSNSRMLRTIAQLTLERDFFQDCFRQLGEEHQKLPEYGQ